MTPYHDLLTNWGIAFVRKRADLAIPGSPERCLFRRVMEDDVGSLWLLEQLAPEQAAQREAVGRLLSDLSGHGLAGLAPYRRTLGESVAGAEPITAFGGPFVCRDWGRCWQLSPFIQGLPLRQPEYLDEHSKGDSLGAWLAIFRRASYDIKVPEGLFALNLPAYVSDLLDRMACARPDVYARASRVLPALEGFFEAYPELPQALCHGDVHPLNVIWGDTGLLTMIDWEFAGVRPELYDLANCLGCLGIEGGGRFDAPFTRALLVRAGDDGLLSDASARWLASTILGTRFGWLSEWLRRGDEEMVRMELKYMDYLSSGSFLQMDELYSEAIF